MTSAAENATEPPSRGVFERALQNAARQADAHGDEAAAIGVLEAALVRHADAPRTVAELREMLSAAE